MIVPGSTIGILGGGQLGRMLILAGRSLGYRFHVFEPKGPCSAGMVADLEINASYDDEEELRRFAQGVDVITLEFENIPVPNNAFSPAYNFSSWTQTESSRYVCGPNWNTHTGAQPNCEITNTTASTQFFAQSENYQYITWSLSSVNPGTGSPLTVIDNEANTTFTQQGILDWTNGFHGSFNLNATAIGCDGVTTSPLSTKSIVIASRAVTPTDIVFP